MTEIELVDLGFKRIDVSIEDTGADTDFYYYLYELSNDNYTFCLMSNESDNTINGKWWVNFMEVEDYKYMDKKQVGDIISSITGKNYGRE